MNEQESFNKELDKIRKNLLIETSYWWGHTYAGYRGIIITKRKEAYVYQYYHRVPDSFKEDPIYIKKEKDLSDEEFERIIAFINDEIINKDYENQRMFDAGHTLVVNYKGTKKRIENNITYGDDIGINSMAEKFIKEIVNN